MYRSPALSKTRLKASAPLKRDAYCAAGGSLAWSGLPRRVSHVKQWAGSVVGNERLLKLYLKYQCRCNELVWLGRAWTAPHKTATPHHITTASHPGSLCGKPAWRRRVPRVASNPNPNPIGQKFVSSPPSIIIAKALPFARCTLKTFESSVAHRCCGCPSLLRLPRGCKNHHGYPPAQRAAHGPRGPI